MKRLDKETIQKRNEASRKESSELVPQSLPNGMEYLPYQIAGIEWMLTHPFNSMLIGDDMGLGKSLQAIGFANERRIKKICIICPSVVVLKWIGELRKFHIFQGLTIQRIEHKSDEWDKNADVTIVSYNMYDQAKCPKKTLLIVDEVHYLKSSGSKRTKAIFNTKNLSKFKFVLGLSGTPMPNRPIELYPILKALCHVAINYCDKHTFGMRFCNARRDQFGRWDYSGHSNLEELNKLLRGYLMIRREKEKVLTQLPGKRVNIVQFDMDATVEKLDAQIRPYAEEIVKRAQHGAGLDGVATHRRLIAERKAPIVAEYIKLILNSTEKVVVFAYHTEVILYLKNLLREFGVAVVTGGMAALQKGEQVAKFVTGDCRVFLGNIIAAGVGIDLVNASKVIFAEADWVHGNNDQAMDRCFRMGQKNFVDVDFLVYKDSVDEYILKTNFKKRKVVNATLL